MQSFRVKYIFIIFREVISKSMISWSIKAGVLFCTNLWHIVKFIEIEKGQLHVFVFYSFSLAHKPVWYPTALYTWRDELDLLRAKLRYTQVSHPVVVRPKYCSLWKAKANCAPVSLRYRPLRLVTISRYYCRFRLCHGVCDATASVFESVSSRR